MELISPAFSAGTAIPVAHTQDGANYSPPLFWLNAPQHTRSYVLTCFDTDVPRLTWYHWVVYNLPANIFALPEGYSGGALSQNTVEAVNDFCREGYDGPSPPPGHGRHRYHFRLLALDTPRLSLSPHCSGASVEAAARPHIIAEAELVGTYSRENLGSPAILPRQGSRADKALAVIPDF